MSDELHPTYSTRRNSFDELYPILLQVGWQVTLSKKKARQKNALIKLSERSKLIKERDNLANWKNPVTGHWLMENGMKPGPEMGKVLAAIKEAILEGDCENITQSAQEFAKTLIKL